MACDFDLLRSKLSFRFFARADWIGIIELIIGIRIPINSAWNMANELGTGVISKPMSSVNSI